MKDDPRLRGIGLGDNCISVNWSIEPNDLPAEWEGWPVKWTQVGDATAY